MGGEGVWKAEVGLWKAHSDFRIQLSALPTASGIRNLASSFEYTQHLGFFNRLLTVADVELAVDVVQMFFYGVR